MSANETVRTSGSHPGQGKVPKLVVGLSALAAVTVYVLSGIYVVKPEQRALVVRCGKVIPGVVLPGTHYHVPYPIDKVYYLKPNEVKNVAITGTMPFREGEAVEDQAMRAMLEMYEVAPNAGAEFLTGDENIIHVALNVQYRIGDPVQFVFRSPRPETLVRAAAEVALMNTVARTPIDDLLTSGKHLVLARVKQGCQNKLRSWDAGIEIISANFASVSPPAEVSDAFKDVASALEDKDRIINEAQGDRSEAIHRARGTAQKTISEALGYREGKVNRAKGDAARFLAVLDEYRQSGENDVSLTRFYIEAMEEVLSKTRKYFIDSPASADASSP